MAQHGNSDDIGKTIMKAKARLAVHAWHAKDKTKLLEALETFSPDDLKNIQKYLPHKSESEIKTFIQKIRYSAEMNDTYIQAPIESWLELAQDLVEAEEFDQSTLLPRVFSVIANFEPFPLPNRSCGIPDYHAIYRYISALLRGLNPPELGDIESAVVLDLLHSLADTLKMCNTELQQKVVKWKYDLLRHTTVDFSNPLLRLESCKKAIENDFTDFDASINLGPCGPELTCVLEKSTNEKLSKSADDAHTGSNESSKLCSSSNKPGPTTSGVPVSTNLGISKSSTSDFSSGQKDLKNKAENGLKSKRVRIATCPNEENKSEYDEDMSKIYRVSDLENPNFKKVVVSENTDCSLIEGPSSVSAARPSTSASQSETTRGSSNKNGNTDVSSKRKKTLPISDKNCDKSFIPAKKPRLFTLNPFCIPVKLLKLKQKPIVPVYKSVEHQRKLADENGSQPEH
ncbi:hypothetical protein CHS0354_038607 [Potamilus streckersoni]|uniref:Uncharacterized protein n=1 Tax=Potamilus streckersoni TaxID=2493646 RepID=A0AAE0TFS2_9BIVA|nr:hypothetical protein CHS0354_038607 [Potamilus streckersoni]